MKKYIQTILIAVLCFTQLVSYGQTITLHPYNNVYLGSDQPNTNVNNPADLQADAWTNNGDVFARGLMQFDFSTIPNNATIVSANLSLYWHESPDGNTGHSTISGSNACWLQRVIVPWNDTTVTWNTQPATTPTDEVAIPESINDTESYPNINVLPLVLDMLATNNYGILMLLQTEQYYRSMLFASMNNADTTVYPALVITYTVPDDRGEICNTIYPSQESFLEDIYGDSVIMGHEDFLATAWTMNSIPLTVRSLMKFDFSYIPPNAVLDSTLLSLYWHQSIANIGHSTLSGPNNCHLKRITSSWNMDSVTWNTQPTITNINSIAIDSSNSVIQNYPNINILPMVNDMFIYGNNGFMFSLDTESYYRSMLFASVYNADSTVLPRLKVCYHINSETTNISNIPNPADGISIFPNPSNGIFNIYYSYKNAEPFTIEVISLLGEKVGNYNQAQILNIADLPDGMYFILFKTDKEIIRKIIVKE